VPTQFRSTLFGVICPAIKAGQLPRFVLTHRVVFTKSRSMLTIQDNYRGFLRDELLERKSKNPLYSVRSFAAHLGVNKTTLSDVLAEKRHLSRKNALKVAEKLNLSPDQTKELLTKAQGTTVLSVDPEPKKMLDDDIFKSISDWYHYAILNLTSLKSNRADAHWVAKRLAITPLEARSAILRLCRLGYLEIKKGKLVRLSPSFDTPIHHSTQALRKYQIQNLHLAEASIQRDGLDRRYASSMVFATRPERLRKAKEMITQFRDEITEYLLCENPTDVYTLAIQVFPLTIRSKET
jgi:uncharacterized protein (TIGR02147 family)